MKPEDWAKIVREINSDIDGMAKALAVRDGVHRAIQHRLDNPTEEQFIDADAFGAPGRSSVFEIYGRSIEVTKIHRLGIGSRDVMGADLFYEVQGVKFALVQYKTPNKSLAVKLDAEQLDELRNACPRSCPPSARHACGSWYAVRSTVRNTYHPACEAQEIFGTKKSRILGKFINGLTQDQFHEEFGACRIGARTAPISASSFVGSMVNKDHVVVHVKDSG